MAASRHVHTEAGRSDGAGRDRSGEPGVQEEQHSSMSAGG